MRQTSSPIDLPRGGRGGGGSSSSPSASLQHSWGNSSPNLGSYSSASPISKSEAKSAAKCFAKIKYSFLYDTSEILVGFVRDETRDKRRSGAEAWSKRVHSVVVDISFDDFCEEFSNKEDKAPFHRVRYFKNGEEVLWEASSSRRHFLQGGISPSGSSYSCSPPFASSQLTRQIKGLSVSAGHNSNGLSGDNTTTTTTSSSTYKANGKDDDHVNAKSVRLYEAEDLIPEESWMLILQELGCKELCLACAVSKHLNKIILGSTSLWSKLYQRTFGLEPERNWSVKVMKQVLCKSERRAAKWLSNPEPAKRFVGFHNTSVLDMDDSHVISGDGQNLRVWTHKTDRRIKTLQGHTAAISCIAFDNEYISSGDITGHLKLWSMDELKNIRSLRAHADTISDTLHHLHTLCITCSLDGLIKVWDATLAQPLVLTLEGNSRLYNMCMLGSKNRLYSAGTNIKGWDLETAQTCVEIPEEGLGMLVDPDEYYGYPVDVWPGTGNCSKAIATNGNLLVSAGKGIINLYDVRTNQKCCSILAGNKGSTSSFLHHSAVNANTNACTGLEIDDWKLVCGFKGVDSGIGVYDIRAAASSKMRMETVMDLSPGKGNKILAFRVVDSYTVAGLEGDMQCCLWDMELRQSEVEELSDEEGRQTRQKKKQNKKCPKIRRKYPKRTTR